MLNQRFRKSATARNAEDRRLANSRLKGAFRRAERDGLQLAMIVRTCALGGLAAWLIVIAPTRETFYPISLIGLFILLGLGPWLLERQAGYRWWVRFLFVTLDSALLAVTLFVPNPLVEAHFPFPVYLRFDWFVYFFILLGFTALGYSAWLVVWSGISGAAAYSLGVLWLLSRPGALPYWPLTTPQDEATIEDRLAAIADPNFIDINKLEQQVVVLVLVALILGAAVWRARRLVRTYAESERTRVNLARYLPPSLVDQLAKRDHPFGGVRQQHVAVLFADMIGFTRFAEAESPEAAIGLLQEFHARLEPIIFSCGGTLEKFLGDGLMASFGTTDERKDDALQAVRCAARIMDELKSWNESRAEEGQPPISVGVGVHAGPAVLGDLGGWSRMEFAVVGDTVNVASRLEVLTRRLGVTAIVSEDAMERARAAVDGETDPELARFTPGGSHRLPGRQAEKTIWVSPEFADAGGDSGPAPAAAPDATAGSLEERPG